MAIKENVRDYIRTIPDFPHEGILFRDVTTLFADPDGLKLAIDQMVAAAKDKQVDVIAGIEARGFIIGAAMAYLMGVGFVAVRKKGKLPGTVISEDYALEYGTATVEIHDDAVAAGDRVLVVDDLLATGGTAEAGIKLMERLGAEIVGLSFVVDLPDLGGREKLEALGFDVQALCAFEGL